MEPKNIRRDIYISMWGTAKTDAYLAEEGRQLAIQRAENDRESRRINDEILAEKMAATPLAVLPSAPLPISTPQAERANRAEWMLKKPQRLQGYGPSLYGVLKAAHAAGLPRPTARDVLDTFSKNKPDGILCVSSDSIDYQNGNGKKVTADMDAIRKTIGRLTLIATICTNSDDSDE